MLCNYFLNTGLLQNMNKLLMTITHASIWLEHATSIGTGGWNTAIIGEHPILKTARSNAIIDQ